MNPPHSGADHSGQVGLRAQVIVVGGGIGGLTTAALLAHRGYAVRVFEQAAIPGGCASTFQRRGFTFDVGATQVAGLEPEGIHQRIFSELGIPLPVATPCDPACAVYLPGETTPINVWRDPHQWRQERQQQFPDSEAFWELLAKLFTVSWRFQARNPVLPPQNIWDLGQLLQALRPETLLTLPYALSTVGDVLQRLGLGADYRLKAFLDLQLKLYSQVGADETALLYAATALSVSQAPQGLSHLQGSMQVLSEALQQSLERDRGELFTHHRVEQIQTQAGKVTGVVVRDLQTNALRTESADHVVANVTVQNLVELLGEQLPQRYRHRVAKLPPASGAFVVYLGVNQAALPANCPPHLQFLYDYAGPIGENNSLFVSVSHPGDGRAPEGQATIVASSFTDPQIWQMSDRQEYRQRKQQYTDEAIAHLGQFFNLTPETILHREAATPRTFARFTARQQGIVGGIGQRLQTFGPFGFAHRTPIGQLWLVGDSVHPGEGTAGVSYGALTVAEQIQAS